MAELPRVAERQAQRQQDALVWAAAAVPRVSAPMAAPRWMLALRVAGPAELYEWVWANWLLAARLAWPHAGRPQEARQKS